MGKWSFPTGCFLQGGSFQTVFTFTDFKLSHSCDLVAYVHVCLECSMHVPRSMTKTCIWPQCSWLPISLPTQRNLKVMLYTCISAALCSTKRAAPAVQNNLVTTVNHPMIQQVFLLYNKQCIQMQTHKLCSWVKHHQINLIISDCGHVLWKVQSEQSCNTCGMFLDSPG